MLPLAFLHSFTGKNRKSDGIYIEYGQQNPREEEIILYVLEKVEGPLVGV